MKSGDCPRSQTVFLAQVIFGGLFTLAACAAPIRIGLIGDVPYSEKEIAELPRMLAAIETTGAQLIIHVGDIKRSRERCDDAVFEARKTLLTGSNTPLLLVPGDNEWTDCDQWVAGHYEPLERLNKLRELFWSKSQTLGRHPLAVDTQNTQFPEHQRLTIGNTLFITLNLPGGNNNFGLTGQPAQEYAARQAAISTWVENSFQLAKEKKLKRIALIFQADPYFKFFIAGLSFGGYRAFLSQLRKETEQFDGEVVAIHGDTHHSRTDHPLRNQNGKILKNFTRVETFGYPKMGWTLMEFDSENAQPIRFTPHPWKAGWGL